MTENKQTYWIVGDKRVDSQLEAYKLAAQNPNLKSRLCFQEEEFDKIFWIQEPTKSWEEVCLEHAVRLRQKYKKLKLFFSAGRDSGHIFRVFEQAKIPIDELIIPYTQHSPLRLNEHVNHIMPIAKELCRRNPPMQITEVLQDKQWYEKLYKNSDWITKKNKQFNLMFLQRTFDELIRRDPDYDSGNCGYILGWEKPSLYLIDGCFTAQVTGPYIQWAPQSMPGVECFYWSPEIYLKQCWMLVNHLEKKYPKCDSAFVSMINDPTAHAPYYDEICKAIGRGEAMSLACGNGLNKVFNNQHWSMKHLPKVFKEEKWKSYNEYGSIVYDIHKNHTYLLDKKTNKIDLGTIVGKRYVIKKQN